MDFINKDEKDNSITSINNVFFDKYMLKANGTFVKIYLYGYRYYYNELSIPSSKEISIDMDILESDVISAWRYWENEGLLKLHYNDELNNYNIEYLQIGNNYSHRPQYSTEQITTHNESDKIAELFKYAGQVLKKTINHNEMDIIFSFYDWLKLPIDVIKLLLKYNSDKHINYIEKVAISWAENDIRTIEQVEEKINLYNKYKNIMKTFKLDRNCNSQEEEYLKKWLKEYNFSTEIISEACNRTILKINNINFAYTDKILDNWYKNNVKSIEDIIKLENEYNEKKKVEFQNKNFQQKKQNKFINYEQREWDFEALDKLEEKYIDKLLEE